MELSSCSWCGLALLLSVTTFGVHGILLLLLYAVTFLAGSALMLDACSSVSLGEWKKLGLTPTTRFIQGLPNLVEGVYDGKPKLRMDKRMTGSLVIDEVLQELLVYTYRDYIHLWYHRISDDDQFQYDIRQTLQRVVVAFSERARKVDLVPYLTHRLVDDFASHIRLYRRTLMRMREQRLNGTKLPSASMESVFFDLELEMEHLICRDQICLDEDCERKYLQKLSEVLMYLLLPPGDFHNKPFRFIVREAVVNGILLPMINILSDPDFINQNISWLCKETMLTSESLLTILRTSDSVEELEALREKVDLDLARLRARDSGGDDDMLIKQQLSSLMYVKGACETRMQQLRDGVDETDLILPASFDVSKLLDASNKLYPLPFDTVVNNAVALSYFIKFMTSIGAQHYLFFYLIVEGYRVSVEQQISAALQSGAGLERSDTDTLREAALGIYNQYLSDKALPRLKLEDAYTRTLGERIQHAPVLDNIFNETQGKVCDMLQRDSRFFPAFQRSPLYAKLLLELDLLQAEAASGPQAEDVLSVDADSQSASSQNGRLQETLSEDTHSDGVACNGEVHGPHPLSTSFTLSASISNTGICREHGTAYTVYLITVVKTTPDGVEKSWDIYRRFSDFFDFHTLLLGKYPSLSGVLLLPKKRAFDNMNAEFLERRRVGLGAYLQALLAPGLHTLHGGLRDCAQQFLQHMHWDHSALNNCKSEPAAPAPSLQQQRSVSSLVRSVPLNLADSVARVSGTILSLPNNMIDGFGRMLSVKGNSLTNLLGGLLSSDQQPATATPSTAKLDVIESGKVGASLDLESDEDSIPLHIMLLLLDEVFELKSRNQWLRRQIVAILQQVAKTMFGDSINRKIVDHVEYLTSPEQIAEYMRSFRDSRWPNGALAEAQPARDMNTRMRTRVVCKAKLFANLSEELEHLIGSETTRQGVTLVFNMLQHACLNRRLAYVVLEGLLDTIFPDNKLQETFRKIHASSPRLKRTAK